ncbi:MAG TPA: glycosyltransferase [Candidatus Saccharimonadales bacterium]|nr:glycosyltransferase [Candidatus Saccharimonadales bacterium]
MSPRSKLSAPSAARPARQPKVVIVHDWLVGGGAERVVEQLHKLYPGAPIYTSYCTREWRRRLDGRVRTGFLQWWPLGRLRKFLPVLRIWWFSHLDLREYDLVISSSSAEAKGVTRLSPTAVHINYCHAPTHYYWSRYNEYLARPGFGFFDPLARVGLKLLVGPLRKWDYKAAQRPDVIIANSTHIKEQIQRYYDRAAAVICPPVDTTRFTTTTSNKKRRGFVIAGRQTPYKRFDLAIVACSKLNAPLTVIGDGPEHRRLRKLAGKSVTFLGRVSDEVVAEEFASARALIFPGLDDFGITPVEAMAAGTPVIAYQAGGALDYVIAGKTGLFFTEPTARSLAGALRKFPSQPFDHAEIARAAERFSARQFRRKFQLLVKKVLVGPTDR